VFLDTNYLPFLGFFTESVGIAETLVVTLLTVRDSRTSFVFWLWRCFDGFGIIFNEILFILVLNTFTLRNRHFLYDTSGEPFSGSVPSFLS